MKTIKRAALVIGVLASPALAASGSWSSQVPGPMVAMIDRASESRPLSPPSMPEIVGGRIERIYWRFEAPPGVGLRAWLCHPERCVVLDGQRGSAAGLSGLSANAPLTFRFALAPGQRPVQVKGLQVIVNYQ